MTIKTTFIMLFKNDCKKLKQLTVDYNYSVCLLVIKLCQIKSAVKIFHYLSIFIKYKLMYNNVYITCSLRVLNIYIKN